MTVMNILDPMFFTFALLTATAALYHSSNPSSTHLQDWHHKGEGVEGAIAPSTYPNNEVGPFSKSIRVLS